LQSVRDWVIDYVLFTQRCVGSVIVLSIMLIADEAPGAGREDAYNRPD
jgi:hypothetical protein